MFFPLIIVVIIIVAEAANFMSNKLTKELIKEEDSPGNVIKLRHH